MHNHSIVSIVNPMLLPSGDRQLLHILDTAWADSARRSGAHLACRLGCTQCCHGAFAINGLDVARLRAGMEQLRSTDPALAAAIETRAHSWITQFAADFPGDPATGNLGASESDQAAFDDFANEAACPALDPATGACSVYAWRPMTCRVFGPPVRMAPDDNEAQSPLGCCELCFTTATDEEVAACEMPVPHELEESLLDQLNDEAATVVAYALVKPSPVHPR